jgi:hypothetical protein
LISLLPQVKKSMDLLLHKVVAMLAGGSDGDGGGASLGVMKLKGLDGADVKEDDDDE